MAEPVFGESRRETALRGRLEDALVRSEALTAEIARLKAELEEARMAVSYKDDVNRALQNLIAGEVPLKARAETAEAAAGAMREALEWVLPMAKGYAASNPVGSNASLILHAESVLENTTIGAEVMRVVRAARKVVDEQTRIHNESPWPQKYRAAFGAIAEMAEALDEKALDRAWEAFGNTPIDIHGDTDDEQRKCLANGIRAYLTVLPQSPVGELVKELRDRADSYDLCGPSAQHTSDLLRQAATALLALQAENERLKRAALTEIAHLGQEIEAAAPSDKVVKVESMGKAK